MNSLLAKLDKKPTYPVGRVNGVQGAPVYQDDDFSSNSEEEIDGNKPYEQEYVQNEMKKYAKESFAQASHTADDMSSVYHFSEVSSIAGERALNHSDIYQRHNFAFNTGIRTDLPIDSYKEQIMNRIELNQVIIIEGPTGCGKTTQVPQIIMDSLREKGQYCNIIVTQPRKIATINVAKRVCEERGWALGTVCGYQVGLEKKMNPDQLITYVTIGVLLQKLIRVKSLRQYTHIIIDEIHERNHELDFLLLLVRKFLFTNSLQTKVILMSATIRADEFAYYFRKQSSGLLLSAPIIKVEKVSKFTKTIFYLDQLNSIKADIPKFDIAKPEIPKEIWNIFVFLIGVFDKLPSDSEGNANQASSVLVFLPGINEIEEAHNILLSAEKKYEQTNQDETKRKLKLEIIPLHSSLPNDEQALVFRRAKPGYRKIILSTNIAESSITVPDSCYVIDFCLTKVMTVDPITKYMSLKLEWATHVNCDQRAGRVGRTCDGRIYRLVTKRFFMEEMERFAIPEILRAPLERIVLHAKMLELNETPSQILALAMNPPNLKNIESTIWQLKEIGGLLKTCRGVLSNCDGDITFLGQIMSTLPINVNLAKMIVLGQLYSCLDETIIIAAGCSIQNIFSIPFQKRLDAYKKLLLWSDGSCSDLIALLNLYTVWQRSKRDNTFASERKELEWCHRNLVSLKGLKEWQLLITEIRERLDRMQVKETVGPGKVHLSVTEKPTVLKIVMAGAFYPNFFIKPPDSNETSERDAVKIVGGRDPFSTVYFTGMDPKQPGHIYVRQIKRMIHDRESSETDIHVGFDGSMKVYVEFKANANEPVAVNIDGFQQLAVKTEKIPRQVYEALRKRQLKYKFDLQVINFDKAWAFAETHGTKFTTGLPSEVTYTEQNCFSSVDYDPVPSLSTQFIKIHISNAINAGHFWAQNADDKTNELLHQIEKLLNKEALNKVNEPLKVGKLYAVRYREDGLFYRSKLTLAAGRVNHVLFIDYGNVQEVTPDEFYFLPQHPQCFIPGLAFECVMYGIKPSFKQNSLGMWNDRTNENFQRWTMGILLYGEVYSVVNDVAEVELYRNPVKDISINQYMLTNGFAEPCEPSFLSKQDNERRRSMWHMPSSTEDSSIKCVDKIISYTDFPEPIITMGNSTSLPLRGPFSPLEARLFGCTSLRSGAPVDIEGTSVNSVLLDTEPQNKHARLLVAAYVGQSATGDRLILRQTTLMPSVPGFPMLLAAIFCPTMEPKLTEDNSLVAAILCGLGYNELNNKPLYPVHDMVIHLDTELKIEELEMVNKLRYLMNSGVNLMSEIEHNRSTPNQLLTTQIQIKDHLFSLLNMEREPLKHLNFAPQNLEWGRHDGLSLLRPNLENEDSDIWTLLWFVKIAELDDYQRLVSQNLREIEDIVYEVTPFRDISCLLCKVEIFFIHDLRLHIISADHKKQVESFRDSLDQDDDY